MPKEKENKKEDKENNQPVDAEVGYIKAREITDEMSESYLDYAMSVIVSRALPDARDGLKPVHRRILFAMNSMGLRANVKFRKSATVVGECFVKDTMILTKKGLMPIQDIEVGEKVYTQNSLRRVICLYEMPAKPLLKVTLNNGLSNVATYSQMFKVLTPDWRFIWKKAKDLTINDYLVAKADYPMIQDYVKLKQIKNSQPMYLNEDLAYVLGLIISEGSISNDYSRKKLPRVRFCLGDEPEIAERIASIFEQEFGYRPTKEVSYYKFQAKDGSVVNNKKYTVRINRKCINEFLVSNFNLEGKKAYNKKIPAQIFLSSQDVIFSFISGMIEGDGSVHKNRNVIHYGSVSKDLIEQLQILLHHQGIFCGQYKEVYPAKQKIGAKEVFHNYPFYSLEAKSQNAIRLARKISLVDHNKQQRATRIAKGETRGCGFDVDVIPYGGKLFQELGRYHLGAGWYQDTDGEKFRMGIKYKAGCKIRYCADLMEKPLRKTQVIDWGIQEKLGRIGSPFFGFLDDVIKNRVYFLKVSSIENVSPEKTYDFQVEGEHEFIANGVVSHNCLGKYHPHGDLAVYDSLVRMAQDFSMRYPLVQGQGNFGSQDGDSAAAQRYTECRLSKIGEEMLADIEKETVNFGPNYDATREEPLVLPSPLPQLLLNGSLGIAVGMATNIPPHNLKEVVEATLHLISHPTATTEDLLQFVQGPDFPTGGIIYGKKDIITAYSQGKGPIIARGKAEIKEQKNGLSQIIITEIPYQVQKSTLVQQFAKLVENKKIEGIKDIRDESDRDGMTISIDLKKEAFPKKILNALYKYTDLQRTFHLNMLALVDGIQPKILSLADVLTLYLAHKKEVVLRRTKFDLEKAKQRAHILEGLMIALKNIDEVIKTIKQSENKDDANQKLQKKFKLTEIQATAILEMRLQNLAKLEREKIESELAEIEKIIKELLAILNSEAKVKEVMKKELTLMLEKYGDIRRTKVVAGRLGEIGEQDLIPQEEALLTLTQGGFIKRMKPALYKTQGRGGQGVSGLEVSAEDAVSHFLLANTLDRLLFFTDSGKVFQCVVWEIAEMSKVSKGRGLLNFLELSPQDKVLSLIPYNKEDEAVEKYLVLVTKNGIIKKTDLSAFANVRRNGLAAIRLQAGDGLVDARIIDKKAEIILVTKQGKSIRFKESDLRPMGRAASGVRGMRLEKEDEVIGMSITRPNTTKTKTDNYLLIITENGFGKRTKVDEYRLQKRGGSGIKAAKITTKNGQIVFAKILDQSEEELIVISKKGQVIRSPINSVRVIGRASSGVRVMRLKSGDKVATAICL